MSQDKKDSAITDAIKKVVSIGVGAAFMTEDAVKTVLKDLPLPKDIVAGLLDNAKNAKEDFTNSLREEIRNHLSKVDPKVMMEDLVEKYDIEVNATLSFKKKEDSNSNES